VIVKEPRRVSERERERGREGERVREWEREGERERERGRDRFVCVCVPAGRCGALGALRPRREPFVNDRFMRTHAQEHPP
jgi:hypothetical protein